jgi:hypothetical protein
MLNNDIWKNKGINKIWEDIYQEEVYVKIRKREKGEFLNSIKIWDDTVAIKIFLQISSYYHKFASNYSDLRL